MDSLVCFLCYKLSFKAFESLKLLISLVGHLFLVEISTYFSYETLTFSRIVEILVKLYDFICDFSSLNGKSDARAQNNQQETTETSLNNFK